MARSSLALMIVLAGCGGAKEAPPVAPAPVVTKEAEPAPAKVTEVTKKEVVKKEPEGPPFVIEKLTVAMNKKSLDLAWDVTRKRDVAAGTILFVHSICKVGYNTKTEDETVSGIDAIAVDAPRGFKLPAFASVGLPFEPTWCTFNFGFGPKGSSNETKLSSFCWKKGAVSEGACS